MKDSLQTLSRIEKFKIDEQRKLLTEQLEREEKLQKDLKMLETRYQQEKEFQAQNEGIGDFGAYVKRYLEIRTDLQDKIAAVQKKIEEIRDIIADMFRSQKTYEIVEANRKRKAQKEQDDKEQKMLDEIGTNAYIKNKQK